MNPAPQMSQPAPDPDQMARAGIRRVPWRIVLAASAGVSTVSLLTVAGVMPLLAAVGVGALAQTALAEWLIGFGGNALPSWVGGLAAEGTGAGVRAALGKEAQDAQASDPAWQAELIALARQIETQIASNPQIAAEMASLAQRLGGAEELLAGVAEEITAQSGVILDIDALLRRVAADLHHAGRAIGDLRTETATALGHEADRVLAALNQHIGQQAAGQQALIDLIDQRADQHDAALSTILAALRSQVSVAVTASGAHSVAVNAGAGANVSVDNSTGALVQGDVEVLQQITAQSGSTIGPIINKQVIQQPFQSAPPPTPAEIAAAQALLAALPTDQPPAPLDALPPGSWMGQLSRNRQFVGRETDLCALSGALKGGAVVAVHQAQAAVASGMGGIGKTQLAVEFAYRYGHYFAGVFWLSFAQADTIESEIARCGGAGHLQLFTEADGLTRAEQANLVRARWACGLPYLLIFDNCEDPTLVSQYNPGGATRVLITSRTPTWPGHLGVQCHGLGVLSRGESIALLRKHRPDLADADADALANELGDLPLALHLAGRFLAGPGKILTVARYLAELRSPRLFERLPARDPLPTGHDRDVFRTFALSYERLDPQEAEAANALHLLARAAHLVPGEVIPDALLRVTMKTDADDLDAQLVVEAALERLIGLGLLEREGQAGLRMHRLVGSYVRQVSSDSEAQAAVEMMVMTQAAELVDTPALAPLIAFLPILRGITDVALARKDVAAAILCLRLTDHLRHLGCYAVAQPYAEHALAINEQVFGAHHSQTARSLNALALNCRDQGNYVSALPLYERAYRICENTLGLEHPDTVSTLNNLANLYRTQSKYNEALALFEHVLSVREQALGSEHPKTASTLNNLALLFRDQSNYNAARPLFERALSINEREYGPNHPSTANSLSNLALLLDDQGDSKAARLLFERALSINEQVLGSDHPETVNVINNLAGALENQDNNEEARILYERALTLREHTLGSTHPDTAVSLNNLAYIYHKQGNYEAAQSHYQRALVLTEQIFGPDHPRTASTLNNLAVVLEQKGGKYIEAREMYERVLKIRRRVFGSDHPDTAESIASLASNYYYLDDLSTAEQLMR